MVLGSCNFNQAYNNLEIKKEDSFKLLEYFCKNGGKIIDSALNYRSHEVIREFNNPELKVITKVWQEDEIDKCFNELKADKIYCILLRDSTNKAAIKKLQEYKKQGLIEKYGVSIYYPNEIIQLSNVIQIPCSLTFADYINTMSLYSDVLVRSYFNFWVKNGYREDDCFIQDLKENKKVDFVVGVDSIDQLKKNMETF